MNRVNVHAPDPYDDGGQPRLAGWFDLDRAAEFDEARHFDGSNHVSAATGSQWDHETLYRTAQGRWVLHRWSQWQGTRPSYEFVDDDQAREWLLRMGRDDDAAEHFGEVEEERGPGRPEVGGAVHVRLGSLAGAVDRWAAEQGVSRAEGIRQLLQRALGDSGSSVDAQPAGSQGSQR
jgi:hypothetical protein